MLHLSLCQSIPPATSLNAPPALSAWAEEEPRQLQRTPGEQQQWRFLKNCHRRATKPSFTRLKDQKFNSSLMLFQSPLKCLSIFSLTVFPPLCFQHFPLCSQSFFSWWMRSHGLAALEGPSVGFRVLGQPVSTGCRSLNLRQEAWARFSVKGHRECLHPWSKSYPEGTGSPWRRKDIPKRKVDSF